MPKKYRLSDVLYYAILVLAVIICLLCPRLLLHNPRLVIAVAVLVPVAMVAAILAKNRWLLWLPAGTLIQEHPRTLESVTTWWFGIKFHRADKLPYRLEKAEPITLSTRVRAGAYSGVFRFSATTPEGLNSIYRLQWVGTGWVYDQVGEPPLNPDPVQYQEWLERTKNGLLNNLIAQFPGVQLEWVTPGCVELISWTQYVSI